MSRRELIAGMEAGAGGSACFVSDNLGNTLAQRQGGAVQFAVPGVESASRTLFQLLVKSCEDARCTPSELASVVIGIGGANRAAERARMAEAFVEAGAKAGHPDLRVVVDLDARIILEGAFDGGPGVVVVAGNDSMVMAKTPRGEVLSMGGWGKLFGSEGSAYYIGREAVTAVAQEIDHLGSSGRLRELFASRLQWDSREKILTALYQDKVDLASLAPLVVEAAAGNDVVAQRIVQRAATLLAEQVRVVVMQMGIHRKVGLVLSGSLVGKDAVYANVLQMKFMKLLPQVEVRAPLHPPVYGAVRLARERIA